MGFAGFVALFWMQNYRVAQRTLQDTSVFANEVVAHLPVGLIATDPQGRIAFFNTSAEKISGISKSSALGQLPDQVMPHGTCGLNDLLQHSLQLIQQDAAAKEVQIQLNVQDGLCRALIDPDRFSQCLLNLYLNAIQAMPDGGRLTIGCTRESSGNIWGLP
ncbi:MAG: PAS domain-containing protein [Desulfobacteraceae bacterium]